jgi:hypothetical protein
MTSAAQAPKVVLRLGEHHIEGVVTSQVTVAMGAGATARATLPIGALTAPTADYRADAALVHLLGNVLQNHFQGLVESVAISGSTATIALANGQEVTEGLLGGLGVGGGFPALELVYAIAITAGLPADRIQIQGWSPGPSEPFEVVVGINGLTLADDLTVGGVRFTNHPAVTGAADDLGPDELRDRLRAGQTWAVAYSIAPTTIEAERAGLAMITLATSWTMLRGHYAASALPSGEALSYDRQHTRTRPTWRDAVLVRGLNTGRRWLRATADFSTPVSLAPSTVDRFDLPSLPAEALSPQERESIEAWRRAVEATDPVARVVAVSEAMEFLVGGVKGKKLFPKAARDALIAEASKVLSDEQRARFDQLVGTLNALSFDAKLDEWLAQHGVALSESDRGVIRRVRSSRNKFVHGESRSIPDPGDLRYATSVVNRLLVHRVSEVAAAEKIIIATP